MRDHNDVVRLDTVGFGLEEPPVPAPGLALLLFECLTGVQRSPDYAKVLLRPVPPALAEPAGLQLLPQEFTIESVMQRPRV